ncbi:MAG: tripartite tricarboxylate transporter substrate-binding protein [Pseudomonadota bacterium]|nr:tripartite tricarboxylate transporter substrate-binding protein [Pseudomonadota bacterium]
MRRFLKILALSLPLAAAFAGVAQAEWPNDKPITVIHAFAPGGDALQRMVAQAMEKALGQTVVFENRPGAGGATGTAYGARQAPDGYTLITAYPGPAANYLNADARWRRKATSRRRARQRMSSKRRKQRYSAARTNSICGKGAATTPARRGSSRTPGRVCLSNPCCMHEKKKGRRHRLPFSYLEP